MAPNLKKSIILVGNGGVGKSYICNKIFAHHSVPTTFKSSASLRTVTAALQWGTVARNGVQYTVVDTPGFYDNSDPSKSAAQVDGENFCKLVATLETSSEIVAILFVFTDRFLEPQEVWYNRLVAMLPSNKGQIVLVHNKTDPLDLEARVENVTFINSRVGQGSPYFGLGFNPGNDQIENLMTLVTQFCPVQVTMVTVPEICYQRTDEGPRYHHVVDGTRTTGDEGRMVTVTVRGTQVLTHNSTGGRRYGAFGPKKRSTWTETVPTVSTRQDWQRRMVTREMVGVYVNVSRVRWDGRVDFVRVKEVDVNLRVSQVVSIEEVPIPTEVYV